MANDTLGWTLSEIADIVGGELNGPSDLTILRPVPAGDDDPQGITFAESIEYLSKAEKSDVAAVIVQTGLQSKIKPFISCENPRIAFGRLLALVAKDLPLEKTIHPTASVSRDADIAEGVSVGANCIIEAGARIASDVKIYPFCYIGENTVIASGVKIYPHVTIYRDVVIGERTIIHAGAVIGADGFGYFWDGSKQRKIPQVGRVIIGDDCEIGALTAIDRATAGETKIENGVKIDNLVQIGHNVEIGAHSVIAGQVGIGGSSKVGSRVVMGGQVGVGDHVQVCDDARFGGQTGIPRDINEPADYWGTPARKSNDEMRISLLVEKLPEIFKRLKRMEQEIDTLRKQTK